MGGVADFGDFPGTIFLLRPSSPFSPFSIIWIESSECSCSLVFSRMIETCFSISSTMLINRFFSASAAISFRSSSLIRSLCSRSLPAFGDPSFPSGINEKLSFADPCDDLGFTGVPVEDLLISSIVASRLLISFSRSCLSASWSLLSCFITSFSLRFEGSAGAL